MLLGKNRFVCVCVHARACACGMCTCGNGLASTLLFCCDDATAADTIHIADVIAAWRCCGVDAAVTAA